MTTRRYATLDEDGLLEPTQVPADLATSTDVSGAISAHEGASDPHAGYLTESAHGGVSPTGHHDRQHSITDTSDHTFPGGTTTFLRADGTFAGGGGGLSAAEVGARVALGV